MPKFGPIKRQDLIRYLKQLGFVGPTKGGKHQHMKSGKRTFQMNWQDWAGKMLTPSEQ